MAILGITVARSLYPTRTFLPMHIGQLFPLILLLILACHSCPFSHCHQTFLSVPAITSLGVNPLFLAKFHCAARSGLTVAKSLIPTTSLWPEQTGQPTPLFLLLIGASHSCLLSLLHCHHTLSEELTDISCGVRAPFLVGCHSRAKSGFFSASEPRFATIFFLLVIARWIFAHSGHPLPLVLWFGVASHSNPQEHFHHIFSAEPYEILSGECSPFFS